MLVLPLPIAVHKNGQTLIRAQAIPLMLPNDAVFEVLLNRMKR